MPIAKVCMLTTGHSALDARIFYKECRSLQQVGYEVSLIAPLNKEGFLVDIGGNRVGKDETVIQDIRIIGFRVKKIRFNKVKSALGLLRLVTIGKFGLGIMPYGELVDKGIELKADVYHCHEMSSLYAGIQIKKKLEKEGRRPKLIYDVHEFHPSAGSVVRIRALSEILRKIIVRFEREGMKYVDYVITVNQLIRGYLLALNSFMRTEVLYNCPLLSIFQEPVDRKIHKDKITICHEGSLRFNRGLKQMIEVMRVLKENYGNKVELLISGGIYAEGREYIEEKLEEYELHDAIKCTGWLPYEKVGEAISQADMGIIFFEPTLNNMFGTPNKLFNYMRYGLPVVSVDLPETSRIISETGCGLVVRDRNVGSLVRALSTLIDDEITRREMGENARRAVYNQYSWEQMEKRLLRVYAELLPPNCDLK